ncbi:hypothetical protein ACRALDRAFT_2040290 [Sodiomyces alcalophilus JCM 7366]|uniref:uncharacterized protein n=1 Tax=Sodiomyces alcalophilus JCM 7366 TaxID=591952 RepID=UPI0039B3E643
MFLTHPPFRFATTCRSQLPALRFQPIRRPQAKTTAKPKVGFPKTIPAAQVSTQPPTTTSAGPTANANPSTGPAAPAPPKTTTLADWAATEEEEWMYGTNEKRQRGGRRKKKKKIGQQQHLETDWEEIYDPSKPTNFEEYMRSDERIREIQDWKAVLYRHRRQKSLSDDSDEEENTRSRSAPNQFAPPPNYAFAPPPPSPPRAAAASPALDATADDAYARRLALSGAAPPPPPPPTDLPVEPPADTATISRAPVRYHPPEPTPASKKEEVEDGSEGYSPPPALGLGSAADSEQDAPEAQQPRSNRPGQAGFAQRLMSKYGWTKGSGLGADQSGIINPLRVQVEKRKKKSDAEGGGWAEPAAKARILGGRRKDEGPSRFGPMSEVIVLRNMLEGMDDLQGEIANGLGQEIGEECGDKYGRVERLYIDTEDRQVFIKFTDQVSALRAVNELDGRIFNGNTVRPSFYDTEKFEQGVYR